MKGAGLKTPLAFNFALLHLAAGCVGLISALLFDWSAKGVSQVSIGLILLGAGEYINNPRVSAPPPTAGDKSARRRNVCALGNLLDIGGVLMIAVGAGEIFL